MRIKRFILFAGPSCSGKTTFFRRLEGEEGAPLRTALGLGDVSSWRYLNRRKLRLAGEEELERVVLHYDLSARFRGRQPEDESLTHLLEAVDELVVVTFWARPAELARRVDGKRRMWRRRMLRPRFLHRGLWKRQKFRDLYRIYSQPSRLLPCYDEWIAFSSAFPAKAHWIVDTSAQPMELVPADDWPRLRARGAGPDVEAQGVRD
jgi:hypothetical protein